MDGCVNFDDGKLYIKTSELHFIDADCLSLLEAVGPSAYLAVSVLPEHVKATRPCENRSIHSRGDGPKKINLITLIDHQSPGSLTSQ